MLCVEDSETCAEKKIEFVDVRSCNPLALFRNLVGLISVLITVPHFNYHSACDVSYVFVNKSSDFVHW